MSTPEELTKAFDEWKSKKGDQLLKLYQKKAAMEKTGEDFAPVTDAITKIETKIAQKKAYLDRRLASIYANFYKSGASSDAKKERKERTHHLCNLGGLIEKSGLGNLEPAVILGMLIQQAEYLSGNPSVLNRWKERGQDALEKNGKDM